VNGIIGCNNSVFGDPLKGTKKNCYCYKDNSSLTEDNKNFESKYKLQAADEFGNIHRDFPNKDSFTMFLNG